MSEQTPMVNQPRGQKADLDPRVIPPVAKTAPSPVTHAERVTFVYFKVWGSTDEALIEAARNQLARFSSVPHGFKIEAEAYMTDSDGTVLTYEGRVTAWPESP